MRLLCAAGLALGIILLPAMAVPASAKGPFRPGELRLCDDQRCVPLVDQKLLNGLALFYYPPGRQPAEVRKPGLGAPYFQLKSGTYVSGIAATAQLDRFRSSCNCGHFGPDDWYRVPAKVARQLRKLAAELTPLRVTESTIGRTRYG
jgi:hypothetical protein